MIKKILNIQKVGRFSSFKDAADELSFSRNTFIFGKNTHGKSTFTAILHSLANGNPDFIIGRKSFDTTTIQNVVIETDDGQKRFNNMVWNSSLDIKIFDSRYITENIYSDDYLDINKQKKIANIILGEEGKGLEKDYERAKEKLYENSNRKTEITNQYNIIFDKTILEFQNFKKLKVNSENENGKHIEKINASLQAVKNQQNIKTLLKILSVNLNKLNAINKNRLSETLEIKQSKIRNHILKNLKTSEGALGFLATGLSFLKEKLDKNNRNCVFCGQKLETGAENLINDYNVLFSRVYKNLIEEIKNSLLLFRQWSIEQEILETQTKLQKLGVGLELGDLIKKITENKNDFILELEQKQKNLNYVINLDSLDELESIITKFNSKIVSPVLKKYDMPINTSEVNKLEKEKQRFEIIKQRYEKPWKVLCDEYQKLENNFKNNLKPAEEKTFNDKKEYAEKVFLNYEKAINAILKKLGANYKLIDFSVSQNRRDNLKLFNLKFLNSATVVPLENKDDQYNFKNTLSDSDKRLLAFAFFVVDIQNIKNLKNTIVVLDDPMSSFDAERKITTIKVLRDNLVNQSEQIPKQLIVLTHEDIFFKFLNEHFTDKKTFLKIIYSNSENTSKIIPCNIKEEFLKKEHFKRLEKFKQYLEGKVDCCNLNDTRKVLEYAIEGKYYLNIDSQKREKGGIISWYLENCDDKILKQKINDLLSNVPHHNQSEITDQDLSDGDKKDIVRNLLGILIEI